jgi:hypothetical protein
MELRSELGDVIENGGSIGWRELPSVNDQRYPYLRLVDGVGDTIFSSYQIRHAVLTEIERLDTEKPSAAVSRLLALAHRCIAEHHSYLWLIGD